MNIPRHTLEISTLEGEIKDLRHQLAEANHHTGKCAECGVWTCGFCGIHNARGEWRCYHCHGNDPADLGPDWRGLCDKLANALFKKVLSACSDPECNTLNCIAVRWLEEYEEACK